MINFTPIPYIPLGSFRLSTHGLMIAAGFLVAEILARRAAARRGLSADIVDNAAMIAAAAGLVGARLVWLLVFGEGMTVLEMFKIWEGGLSSYGGLIFGVAAGLLYVHRRKTEVMKFADAVFPYLLLGWAIGRVGCFLNWDSYGQMTSVAWGVVVDGIARHPTQIYEAIGYLASFLCVLAFFRTKHGVPAKSGNVAAASMFLFALTRFVVDFFRADPSGYLILSRVLAVTLMILALATELRTRRRTRMV